MKLCGLTGQHSEAINIYLINPWDEHFLVTFCVLSRYLCMVSENLTVRDTTRELALSPSYCTILNVFDLKIMQIILY